MGLQRTTDIESRFVAYVDRLAGVIGHGDRSRNISLCYSYKRRRRKLAAKTTALNQGLNTIYAPTGIAPTTISHNTIDALPQGGERNGRKVPSAARVLEHAHSGAIPITRSEVAGIFLLGAAPSERRMPGMW